MDALLVWNSADEPNLPITRPRRQSELFIGAGASVPDRCSVANQGKCMFVVREEVFFHQCDPAGYLFFAESFVLAHKAIERFLSNTQIGRSGWFEHETVAFPLRHAECDYQSPLRAGDRCDLTVQVVKVSTSSVVFDVTAVDDGRPCFSVTSVHTAMSRSEHTKVALPSEVRSVLESR